MIILHGENLVLSRQRLTEKVASFQGEIIRFQGDQLTLTDLKQALESSSLFGQDRLVVIENLFSQRPSQRKDELIAYCRQEKPDNLLLWERKTIDGRRLRSFSQAKIEIFKLSPLIFKFLDSLNPENKKNSLLFFRQTLKQEAVELIFYLLCRRIRNLIIAADLGFPGLTSMAPWQKTRLVSQAKKFSLPRLLAAYQILLKIDTKQKTGQAAFSLTSQLDLWLTSF